MITCFIYSLFKSPRNMADYDKDGKLSLEEFVIAMHLCDFSKAGNLLPSVLPLELQPQRSRASTQSGSFSQLPGMQPSLNASMSPDNSMNTLLGMGSSTMTPGSTSPALPLVGLAAVAAAENSLTAKQQAQLAATFEDKRRENFDRGNAVLEAKRQALREAEDREKREREEKERLEQEKRQKIREEQERRRLAEIERQMERQRMYDAQREEERKKALEQREAARNELIRQQRLEWERQKKQELEAQKLKLHEQLSTLKAKDKNLEYDMQTLVRKFIYTYKGRK